MKKYLSSFFLAYLRLAAQFQIWKIKPKHIIGITGSAGKSSCREAIYAILKEKYLVKQSSSGNSETGLPLDILGFTKEHNYSLSYWFKILLLTPVKLLTNWDNYEIYIAEMGVDSPDEPKNMTYLLKIIRPDIGIFLNALPVHTEYFQKGSATEKELVRRIADQKGKLITSLPASGYAIINSDDPNVHQYQNKTEAKVVTLGTNGEVKNFILDIPGFILTDDYGYTLAAAVATAKVFGVSPNEAKALLAKNYKLPPGRMSIFKGIKESTIIDSSYNASRIPTISALRVLHNYPGKRKIAVLGDMRELGDLAKEEHEAVAKEAVNDADYIFTFGPLMEEYFLAKARNLKYPSENIKSFQKMSELVLAVKGFVKTGDVILIKGSQNTILLEILVEKLLADPNDKTKLCRRGIFWEKKRQELYNN